MPREKTFSKFVEALDTCFLTAAFFITAVFFASLDKYFLSGLFILVFAVLISIHLIKKNGDIVQIAAFFSISWLGGCGVSALKLSNLEKKWCLKTWLIFGLIYICFYLGFILLSGGHAGILKRRHRAITLGEVQKKKSGALKDIEKKKDREAEHTKIKIAKLKDRLYAQGLFAALNITAFISLFAFVTEVVILGYIPLFTVGVPHAYSYFHVKGLHYFTVSFVLIPALFVLYLFHPGRKKKLDILHMADLVFCISMSLLLPILLVSRFELIQTVLLAGLTFLCVNRGKILKKINKKLVIRLAFTFLCLLVLYVFITFKRAHSEEYLEEIYEMKYDLPIFISQPYIYVANNYDNFNALITELKEYAGGLRQLYPFLVFSGLKFLHPEWISFPLYLTREELTTLTMFYDAYYDFGTLGVISFAFVMGLVAGKAQSYIKRAEGRDPILLLIIAQFMTYLLLSFFTTWFSNPTCWFYFIASCAMYIFVRIYLQVFEKLEQKNQKLKIFVDKT